jgi:hypothetical protein
LKVFSALNKSIPIGINDNATAYPTNLYLYFSSTSLRSLKLKLDGFLNISTSPYIFWPMHCSLLFSFGILKPALGVGFNYPLGILSGGVISTYCLFILY